MLSPLYKSQCFQILLSAPSHIPNAPHHRCPLQLITESCTCAFTYNCHCADGQHTQPRRRKNSLGSLSTGSSGSAQAHPSSCDRKRGKGRLCHHETDDTSLPGRTAACLSPAHAHRFRLHGGTLNEFAWQHPPWNTPLSEASFQQIAGTRQHAQSSVHQDLRGVFKKQA